MPCERSWSDLSRRGCEPGGSRKQAFICHLPPHHRLRSGHEAGKAVAVALRASMSLLHNDPCLFEAFLEQLVLSFDMLIGAAPAHAEPRGDLGLKPNESLRR